MACICDDLNNIDIGENEPHANIDDSIAQIQDRCECVGVVDVGVNPVNNNLLKEAFANKPIHCCSHYVVFSRDGNMWSSNDGINWCQVCGTEVAVNDTCTLIVDKSVNIDEFDALFATVLNSDNCTAYTVIYDDNSMIFKREADDTKWHVVFTRKPFNASVKVSDSALPTGITASENDNIKFDEILVNDLDIIKTNPFPLTADWGTYYIEFDYDGYAFLEFSMEHDALASGDTGFLLVNLLRNTLSATISSDDFFGMCGNYIQQGEGGDTGTVMIKTSPGDYIRAQYDYTMLALNTGIDITKLQLNVIFYPF